MNGAYPEQGRITTLFNDGWRVCVLSVDAFESIKPRLSDVSFENRAGSGIVFRSVGIPHDWLIEDTGNLGRSGAAIYRKEFVYRTTPGRKEYLRFDGVYMDSRVYLNGTPVWEWKNGYTAFTVDITKNLRDGANTLLVTCRNDAPNSRWYSGSGIYRNVRRISVDERHILPDGIYIHTEIDGTQARVEVDTECSVEGGEIRHRIMGADGGSATALKNTVGAAVSTDKDPSGTTVAESRGGAVQSLVVRDPELWSPDTPALYTLVTELWADGAMTDCVQTRFGFRETRFDPNEGFFLNGRHMKINGVCLHHDHGALGAAFHVEAVRRQLLNMKAMGANAIRCAHNPMAPEFYDLCDELGLLVMSELTDVWRKPKTRFDYARFFDEWVERDVASWILSERNHPSIILWSVGNEIYDTHEGPGGRKTLRRLVEEVRRHDPKGNARVTLCSNYMPWENTQKCADYIKLIGYNYAESYYGEHHRAHPDWIIFGSETGSLTQSRGVYHFPLSASMLSDDDMQCSSLGNSRTSWGAKSADACVTDDRDARFSPGQFVWSGWDYLGEPTPYHSKNSFLGLVDTAGFPKDIYYVFQSAWTDARKAPMLHLFPYWDFNEGQIIDVRACTNYPYAGLFVNGESQGLRRIDHRQGETITADWRVPYTPGYIEAIAYDEDGHIVATTRRESFGDAAVIAVAPERDRLRADGTDLVYIQISTCDKDGRPVENANNRIEVSVGGAARLVGIDNGNSADYDPLQGTSKRLFSGKLIAIIKAKTTPGEIFVRVSSPGLPDEEIKLFAEPAEVPPGIEEAPDVVPDPLSVALRSEIPVRKIELSATCLSLSAEQPIAEVIYRLLPANNTYPDVEWRISDERGIDSPLAEIEPFEGGVRVRALGDGPFVLRCSTRNGGNETERYSVLSFEAKGLGAATLNPYEYITGGLYTLSGGEIGNGNERGFSTARDGQSYAGFERIDFGRFGSDEMTMDVFCLDSDPLPIELWEGEPDVEGSRLIAELMYRKPSVWNTYQSETYRLNERLTGIRTLCLRLPRKAHIRGFSFARKSPAFEKRFAVECDGMIGDSFERRGKAIHGIGNNVSITFLNLDFGEKGTRGIEITGRTDNPLNTAQIRFRSAESGEETVRVTEFSGTGTPGFDTQRFAFEPVTGLRDVTFIFLPGSDFDFESFRFRREEE
ncbi:MAG: glycoside hydrolase family 2 TIM barrel-domain containing protein [Oscillospiraceae bacterium]|nr:glycoside hydrolase family 2 TIM barrel-domain containing protein [Oscillospiraceae bacterium]